MESQMARANINENLLRVFTYAFVETAPYGFYIPKSDQYVEVNLVGKVYHCLSCDQIVTVEYNQNGTVYFSKARFEKQRKIYEKRMLAFPSDEMVQLGTEFICHEEGYCCDCAESVLSLGESAQKIYNLCRKLHCKDMAILDEARRLMGQQVKQWLGTIEESSQLAYYDLPSYAALKDLICAVILEDLGKMEACLAVYRAEIEALIGEIDTHLAAMGGDTWKAYAARPTTIYESMSDELYHEYTVVFPVKETEEGEFYVSRTIERSRVQMFLEQARVRTVEELLLEAGFMDCWVDWLIDRVTALKK